MRSRRPDTMRRTSIRIHFSMIHDREDEEGHKTQLLRARNSTCRVFPEQASAVIVGCAAFF